MQTEPTQTGPESISPTEVLPLATERKLLAPIWHTILVIGVILVLSFLGSPAAAPALPAGTHAVSQKVLIAQYLAAIGTEAFLLILVWFGIRMKRVTLRELIGGRWKTPEDFLLDLGIALAFWVISLLALAGLGYALGLTNPSQVKEAQKLADMLAPQGWVTIVIWIFVSTAAGFVEEIVFRGYLQRQLAVITGNIYAGLVISALIFGSGHGYEGTRRMVLIAVYGAMFGVLTLLRKSLRPGMIAHAWHDAFEGILLRVISQKGGFLSK